MEGFSRPPLPPPPSTLPSLRSHNSDRGMRENLIDRAVVEISETGQYPEIQQLENTDLLEISQDELQDRAKDKKFKRLTPICIMDIFFFPMITKYYRWNVILFSLTICPSTLLLLLLVLKIKY